MIVRRMQASFCRPKEDECKITLRSESGDFIVTDLIAIHPLGKDRAIVAILARANRPQSQEASAAIQHR
uniref:Uncharacterized protein n=1 Tax=Trichogramma kaykai TaxID=54128 RepID=A0ABD2XBV9_9HYME